jgi:hypothetical protein
MKFTASKTKGYTSQIGILAVYQKVMLYSWPHGIINIPSPT